MVINQEAKFVNCVTASF